MPTIESCVQKKFESLEANARELFVVSMRWMDDDWDEAAGLLWASGDTHLVNAITRFAAACGMRLDC